MYVCFVFFTIYCNTFRHTYVEREAGESSNDRNDRAIREAAKWYNKHLQTSRQIQTILLTNDADNRKKALDQGLQSYTSQCSS